MLALFVEGLIEFFQHLGISPDDVRGRLLISHVKLKSNSEAVCKSSNSEAVISDRKTIVNALRELSLLRTI